MSKIIGSIKSIPRAIRRKLKRADEKAKDEAWKRSYASQLLPSRMEVYDTHLRFDERTYVRCLVCVASDQSQVQRDILESFLVRLLRDSRSYLSRELK